MTPDFERFFYLTREGLQQDPAALLADLGLEQIRKEIDSALSQTLSTAAQTAALVSALVAHQSVQVHQSVVEYFWVWDPDTGHFRRICILKVELSIADVGVLPALLTFEDRQLLP
ncbi:MAG: hypothetical protein IT453_15300 [Planctomycetes bacterium]|nr:hypothetical protein [Planctomycetota bacterium]